MKKSSYTKLFQRFFLLLLFISFSVRSGTLCAQPLDRPPETGEVFYSPESGMVSPVNPPPFIWLPHKGVDTWLVQYSTDALFSPEKTVTAEESGMTVHIPTDTISPGLWYWRYGFYDGSETHFSKTRSFKVPSSAVVFPLVTAEMMLDSLPGHRPRLYFSPELKKEIRRNPDGRYAPLVHRVIWEAERILRMEESLYPEPDPWPAAGYEERYRETWRTIRPYSKRMVNSALAWIFTGDERFAEEARRRLMHFMRWEVDGPSGIGRLTEPGMNIIENSLPVFDWIYDYLTEEEREQCVDVLTARLMQIDKEILRARPMEARPYSSHAGRMIGFMIEGAIVLADESPLYVKEWLDYTLKLLWNTYPAWGGADGGWQEGIRYWSHYMQRMARVLYELDIYGIPLKNKPFFKNTGWFGLYVGYPDRPLASFGDEHHLPPGTIAGRVNYTLSTLYNDPYLRWHAEISGAGPVNREAVRVYQPDLEAKSPVSLPGSRLFKDVGIVAMHHALAKPEENIMMLFQSNPFGGISHSHASQNAFIIEAFGEPLAISSGYSEGYGGLHHREWVRQSKAHNTILVNKEGQIWGGGEAHGRIIAYEEKDDYVYAAGEAAPAYGNRLKRFERHIVFVRNGYIVIIDELKTKEDPATFQWLFHATKKLEIDPEAQVFISSTPKARLTGRFLHPDNLHFTQKTGFVPPPPDPDQSPSQFHLSASTIDTLSVASFITVLWIERCGKEPIRQQPSSIDIDPGDSKILYNNRIEDQEAVNAALQNAELLETEEGIALRVGNDYLHLKEKEAKRDKPANGKEVRIRFGYFK